MTELDRKNKVAALLVDAGLINDQLQILLFKRREISDQIYAIQREKETAS